MAMSEIMKCPKCGGKHEKSVMQASGAVFWNQDNLEEHWTSTSILFEGRKTILESPTWRCKNCHLAVFDYGKEYLLDK
jgi:hypothetical protein